MITSKQVIQMSEAEVLLTVKWADELMRRMGFDISARHSRKDPTGIMKIDNKKLFSQLKKIKNIPKDELTSFYNEFGSIVGRPDGVMGNIDGEVVANFKRGAGYAKIDPNSRTLEIRFDSSRDDERKLELGDMTWNQSRDMMLSIVKFVKEYNFG